MTAKIPTRVSRPRAVARGPPFPTPIRLLQDPRLFLDTPFKPGKSAFRAPRSAHRTVCSSFYPLGSKKGFQEGPWTWQPSDRYHLTGSRGLFSWRRRPALVRWGGGKPSEAECDRRSKNRTGRFRGKRDGGEKGGMRERDGGGGAGEAERGRHRRRGERGEECGCSF